MSRIDTTERIEWTKSESESSADWLPVFSWLYEDVRVGDFQLHVSTRKSSPNGQTWWTLSRIGMTDKSGWYTIAGGDQETIYAAKYAVIALYQKIISSQTV